MATKERIFFGSLELQEKEKLAASSNAPTPVNATTPSNAAQQAEILAFSLKALEAQAKHQKLLQQLEQTKRARQIAVPTNDSEVQARLRELREPIILFGEKPEDRRTRLRELLAKLNLPDIAPPKEYKRRAEEKEELEAYLTEGVPELRTARQQIAEYSIARANQRIQGAKRKRDGVETKAAKPDFTNFSNTSSEIGDERPLTAIAFAPSSKLLATGSWGGLCKLWDVATCKHRATLRGHIDRIHDVRFHPQADNGLSPHLANLATVSSDCTVALWPITQENTSADSASNSFTPLASLKGHTDRANCVAFHPSGNFIATGSSDKTWRLWDINTSTSILLQEGHSRAIHGLAFQCDGSLIVTGGEDTIIRVWDLRSGKTVLLFQGHVKQIVDMDFAPNGYQVASGSEDHTVRIWDMRKKTNVNVVLAHTGIVSSVRYQSQGDFLLSSSFDKTCKIWDTSRWAPVKVLSGHEGRIMAADITPDSKYIASACYDRTWKMWCDEHASLDNVVETMEQ